MSGGGGGHGHGCGTIIMEARYVSAWLSGKIFSAGLIVSPDEMFVPLLLQSRCRVHFDQLASTGQGSFSVMTLQRQNSIEVLFWFT